MFPKLNIIKIADPIEITHNTILTFLFFVSVAFPINQTDGPKTSVQSITETKYKTEVKTPS